jgi:hypothetical protein
MGAAVPRIACGSGSLRRFLRLRQRGNRFLGLIALVPVHAGGTAHIPVTLFSVLDQARTNDTRGFPPDSPPKPPIVATPAKMLGTAPVPYVTDQRLKGYLDSYQLHREQMCLAVMAIDKRFSDVRPRHPRGGPDGARDIEAVFKESLRAFGAVGFVNRANASRQGHRTTRVARVYFPRATCRFANNSNRVMRDDNNMQFRKTKERIKCKTPAVSSRLAK